MPEIYHAGVHASLTKRGRYYRADWKVDGERHRRSTGSTDLEEAREIACELIERSTRRDGPAGSRTLLSAASERMWREKWRHQSAGAQRRQHVAEAIELIGDIPIDEIGWDKMVELRDALDETGVAEPTVNRKLLSVRAILGQAAGPWELIKTAPKAPLYDEGEGRPRALTDSEVAQLLEVSSSDEWRWFWRFLIETGLRKGEALRLKWSDFNLEPGQASVTVIGERLEGRKGPHRRRKRDTSKSKGTRTVPLGEPMRCYLRSRLDGAATDPFDVSLMRIRTEWNRCRQAMGLEDDWEFVVHALRHTCATNLAKRGAPPTAIKNWLGHSSFKTTERYINLVASDLREYSAEVA